MIFNEGNHCLEAGVPLIASEDETTNSNWFSKKTYNVPAFKRIAFIYGFFACINIQFGIHGFGMIFIKIMARTVTSESAIIEKLSDIHQTLFWIHALISVTYITAMYSLNDMLLRFGFDLYSRASPGKVDEVEDLETGEEFVIIYEIYFALGNLVSLAFAFRSQKSNNTAFDFSDLLHYVDRCNNDAPLI